MNNPQDSQSRRLIYLTNFKIKDGPRRSTETNCPWHTLVTHGDFPKWHTVLSHQPVVSTFKLKSANGNTLDYGYNRTVLNEVCISRWSTKFVELSAFSLSCRCFLRLSFSRGPSRSFCYLPTTLKDPVTLHKWKEITVHLPCLFDQHLPRFQEAF